MVGKSSTEPIHYPPIPFTSGCCSCGHSKTTTQDSYVLPKKSKPIVTREGRFEQYLWHEMYYEYVRSVERGENQPQEPVITEYKDQFVSTVPRDIRVQEREHKINIVSKYPVYGTEAISYWNPSGRQPNEFRAKYLITRPVALQATQFG